MEEKVRKQIAEFQMPQATIGKQVLWYRNARRSGNDAMVAYMLHCGARTAQLFLASGRRVDAVRHIDDPKLGLSPEQREQGAWDFTQDSKDFIKYKQDMEDRVSALEKTVAQLTGKKQDEPKKKRGPKPGTDNLVEYRRLKKMAESLGLNPNQKMKKLKEDIKNAQAGSGQRHVEQPDAQRFAITPRDNTV